MRVVHTVHMPGCEWARAGQNIAMSNAHLARASRAFMTTIGLAALTVAPAAAAKTDMVFNGIITHLTGDNLKVRNPKTGQTVGFALVSKALHVFGSDRSTVALNRLHPGQYVKVIYDRKFLGVAHADRVYVLNLRNQRVTGIKN